MTLPSSNKTRQAEPNSLGTRTRRELLQHSGLGLGSVALSSLLADDGNAMSKKGHHRPRAKNVIFLHFVGAPSQLDLFEPKPELVKNSGKDCPAELLEGQRFAFLRGTPKLLGSQFKFQQANEGGLMMSELMPHLQQVGEELCLFKTIQTEQFNHAPAQLFLQTGFPRFGRPSMGSWISYGLGSENSNLPAYVVMITGQVAGAGNSLWGSGFLPTAHQGIEFRSKGDPVLFLSNPQGIARDNRRNMMDTIELLNRKRLDSVGDPEISTRISQYEMAFRMQSSVPELMDLSDETDATHQLYGTEPGKASFANNCLLARRLVERGVRFVQLFDQGWDHHGSVFKSLRNKCQQVDRPIAALLTDLKQRGLLDDTLVVWASEFGRTPMLQGDRPAGAGRDHHKDAFCAWFAGGGSRKGTVIGKTDDLGYFPVEDPLSVHDLQATLLHLLGLDHTELTYKYQGRDFRLTDVHGTVIKKALA